jgi:tail tape-measure protein
MAVNVGTLTIDLKANTASFSQSMDKMANLSAKTASDISKSLSKIAVAGVAAVGAVAASLTALVHSALEAADSLDKLSQSTGTTTETLSVLQYAAALSNVETEQLSVALVKLSKAEFQAATGNVEMARVFKKLGVDAADSNKHLRDSGIVYEELAVKFAQMADGPVKTALAIQLFGKSGAAQIPLLNQLGANLAAIQKEAEQFGLVMGTSVAHLAGEAHDQIDRLHQVVKGLGYSILGAVLPALSQLLDKLIDIAKHADIPGLAKSFGDTATKAINDFGNALDFATKHAKALKLALEALVAVQLGKLLLPFIADLMTKGWVVAGEGVTKFITKTLGLTKVIPVIQKIGSSLWETTKIIGMLARSEGIIATLGNVIRLVFVGMGGWIGVAIAAVVGLGVVLYKLRDNFFTLAGTTYKVRDIWNAAWIVMGNSMKWVASQFSGFIDWFKKLWSGFINWFSGMSIVTTFKRWFEEAFAWAGKLLGKLTPQWAIDALDQAKREREAAEKAAAAKKPGETGTTKSTGTQPDVTGLGKPEADPFTEAKKKLDLAIDAQQKYLAVLHGTPEEIQKVTAAEKAEALILEINNKLKEKDKSLTASQEAEIRQRVAKEESLNTLDEYGKSLVEQQRQTQLTIAQQAVLTEAYRHGDAAVRQVTVSNAILALTVGKTQEQISAMRDDLTKLAGELLKASDDKVIQDFTKASADQQKQLQLSTQQALLLANAYQYGDAAVQAAQIDVELLALKFGKTDAEIQKMTKDLLALGKAMRENQAAQQLARAEADLKNLQDEAEQQRILASAIFGTIDARRQAEIQAKTKAIEDAIAAASDEKLIASLKKVRAQIIANMQAAYGMADANEGLRLRSPLEVFDEEDQALQKAVDALAAAHQGTISYGESLVIAAKQTDNFNKLTDETINLLLRSKKATDGFKAFFYEMQKEAITTARIIYDALHSAFEKISDQLTELITTGKADFAAMLRDIGKQMVHQSIQALMQKGLAAIGKKFGIDLVKNDGSSESRALWVRMAGNVMPIGQKPGQAGGAQDSDSDTSGKMKDMLGGLWSKMSSIFGTIAKGAWSVLKSVFGAIIPHAAGGPVSPSTAYLVGERGPEILLGASGHMLSNDASRRLLIGGESPSVHYYNIDARGTDPVLTEQRTKQAIIAAHNSAVFTSGQVQQQRALRQPSMMRR